MSMSTAPLVKITPLAELRHQHIFCGPSEERHVVTTAYGTEHRVAAIQRMPVDAATTMRIHHEAAVCRVAVQHQHQGVMDIDKVVAAESYSTVFNGWPNTKIAEVKCVP
jgi:hypothetical protein